MNKYFIITFENTLRAIQGESVVKNHNIKYAIMPTPTTISKSCGISIKLNEEEFNQAVDLIKNNTIEAKAIYRKENLVFVEVKL